MEPLELGERVAVGLRVAALAHNAFERQREADDAASGAAPEHAGPAFPQNHCPATGERRPPAKWDRGLG